MNLLRRAGGYLWPYRWGLGVGLVQVAALSALELLKPWPLKIVLDHVLVADADSSAGWAGFSPGAVLALASLGLILVYALLGAVTVLHNRTTISIGQAMVHDLRGHLYAHLQRLSLQYHARARLGDLIYRVTNDTYALQTLAMNGLFPAISATLLLAGMFIVMLRLDARLTIVAFLVCPLLLVTVGVLNRRMTRVAMEARQKESAVLEVVQGTLGAIRVVQAFSAEDEEHRRFLLHSRASLRSNLRMYILQTVYGAASNLVIAAGTAAVLWVGVHHVWENRLTVGEMVVFVSYIASFYAPVNAMVQTAALAQSAWAGVRRVFDLLDQGPPLLDGRRAVPGRAKGQVELREVTFAYESGRPALRGVSLQARPGDCIAIVGPSGAGKSTLVALIPRLFDPIRGAVLLDGVDVREMRLGDLRRQVGMVLQPPVLFPVSIRENIAYGQPDASQAQIEEAARLAQADEFIRRLPAGYETLVGQHGAALSEGERQRLAIARALLRDSAVLILDEPTSALDAATETAILKALEHRRERSTTFIIAHRLSTIRYATSILFLAAGEVLERGGFEELMARNGPFRALYATELRGEDEWRETRAGPRRPRQAGG